MVHGDPSEPCAPPSNEMRLTSAPSSKLHINAFKPVLWRPEGGAATDPRRRDQGGELMRRWEKLPAGIDRRDKGRITWGLKTADHEQIYGKYNMGVKGKNNMEIKGKNNMGIKDARP